MKRPLLTSIVLLLITHFHGVAAAEPKVTVASFAELAEATAGNGREITLHVHGSFPRGDGDLPGNGHIAHCPLPCLSGGLESDVEVERIGDAPQSLVHAIATIAGRNHRVRLGAQPGSGRSPMLPILVGSGMPPHAEMASASAPATTENIDLSGAVGFAIAISGGLVTHSKIANSGREPSDVDLRKDPGPLGSPANGIADGQSKPKNAPDCFPRKRGKRVKVQPQL